MTASKGNASDLAVPSMPILFTGSNLFRHSLPNYSSSVVIPWLSFPVSLSREQIRIGQETPPTHTTTILASMPINTSGTFHIPD
jgi:hypothetical protein